MSYTPRISEECTCGRPGLDNREVRQVAVMLCRISMPCIFTAVNGPPYI